jgi:hypothetical protein
LECSEDVGHRCVEAIEDDVDVPHWRQITGSVHEQERYSGGASKQAVHESAGGIALLCVDENTTRE